MPVDQSSSPARRIEQAASPRIFSNVMLVAILIGSCYLDYWSYSIEFHKNPQAYLDIVRGVALAPAQYRIGVVDPAEFVTLHTHIALRVIFTLVDLLTGLAAGFTLIHVLRKSDLYQAAEPLGKWFAEATFLALILFYLAWLTWYQRPETLATAALLAFSLYLLTLGRSRPSTVIQAAVVAGLLLVSICQSFVRADVALALNFGILVVSLLRREDWSAVPRLGLAATAALGMAVAAGIQYLLMHRIYPHATYGDTKVVQLFNNLKDPLGYPPFVLFMLPFLWTLWRVLIRKTPVPAAYAAVLVGATLFLCMWSVVGITQEVRIFLPFALLLAPVTVTLVLGRITSPQSV